MNDIIALITAVQSFFLAAGGIGAYPVRTAGRIGTGVIRCPAAPAPILQKAMVAGKTAVRYRVHAFPCLPAQFILDPAHRFDMHNPVAGKRHLDQTSDIFPAPIVDQPDGGFVRTNTVACGKFFFILWGKLLF